MIKITNLVKRFDDLIALKGINLKISDGKIYGLLGANGSGKSTLLRLISGVYLPDYGEIKVDFEKVSDNAEIKSRIFFLPDTPYFIHQTNLKKMAAFYKMMYPTFSQSRFEYLCRVFPIDSKAKISSMSKGMQRQAALMLALSCNPKYLLLDEAFDGLDPIIREVVKKLLITGIAENDMTVIIASHNLRELEDLCDSAILLYKGQVIFNNEIDALKDNLQKIQLAYKTPPEEEMFDGIDVVKSEKHGSVIQLIARGSKEDVFERLSATEPLFIEAMTPTLEELFIYELEAKGYDVQSVLK